MNFKYVIAGDHQVALAIHSGLNILDFEARIKASTMKLHPRGRDTVWRWGGLEVINPKVYTVGDWADHGPALIHPE